MARPREFEEQAVISLASHLFATLGFNGTSIDDLLAATSLKRGSLYKAFGSKRNLFELCLRGALDQAIESNSQSLDLLIVALKELAPTDPGIRGICREFSSSLESEALANLLGKRLLANLKEK
jgi:AcrR family transcriptional regulator